MNCLFTVVCLLGMVLPHGGLSVLSGASDFVVATILWAFVVRLRFFGCKDVCVCVCARVCWRQHQQHQRQSTMPWQIQKLSRHWPYWPSAIIIIHWRPKFSSYHNNKLLSTLINHPRGSRKVSEGGGFRFESHLPYQKAHPSRMVVRRHPFPAPISGVVPVVGGPNKAFS